MKKIELKADVNIPAKQTSEAWTWPGAREWFQGAISAVLGSVLGVLLPSLQSGNLVFNWELITGAALTGFLSYIFRKLPQQSKYVIDKSDIDQMKK